MSFDSQCQVTARVNCVMVADDCCESGCCYTDPETPPVHIPSDEAGLIK